jgi:membrane-bound lytic murein transglycosylase D
LISSQVHPSESVSSARQSSTARQAQVASEKPIFRFKAPQQIPVSTSRMLPKPEFGVTPEVQRELDYFLTRERSTVVEVLQRRQDQQQMLEKVFEGEGVPAELLNVAAIESRFDPKALSPAGARGMWQFMKSTAKVYGLKVSGKLDERTDPIRSSIAAARHLRDLFLNFNDWHLALAAYNAGLGRINKLVSRRGETDFWELVRAGELSSETARFVPRVIALTMIVNDPDRYGFASPKLIG